MVESDVLKFGSFTLKSGRQSPFFMNAGAYVTGYQLKKLGEYYAQAIHDNFGDDFDVLFGPAYKGIPLAVVTCLLYTSTGTSVQNGTAMALVVATGSDTYLGGIAKMLNGRGEKSAFDRGVSSISMLLVRLMLVMAPAVFAINAATKGNVIEMCIRDSIPISVATAGGLTCALSSASASAWG